MGTESRISIAFAKLSQRNTEQRRIIFEKLIEFEHTGETFSAENLWQELRKTNPRIGRATIFRLIEKLEEEKVLDRIDFADGTHCFKICSHNGHHHHLTCTQCRRIVEFDYCIPNEQILAIETQANFEIDGHSLTLFGRCENCRNKLTGNQDQKIP
jgi:Fur family transcriptional regulator, ferric uptake regulator